MKTSRRSTKSDDQRHLIEAPEILRSFGLVSGRLSRLENSKNGSTDVSSKDCLVKVYVEATNACNLDCRTCMRNVWDEELGFMEESTFSRLLTDLEQFQPRPLLFFGGFGEPLTHPELLNMIYSAKDKGHPVELITNGTLLNKTVSRKLIELGIERIWVSLDGSTPESYADVRLGNELPRVIENLNELADLRKHTKIDMPKLGIAFVAMKRNIADLPAVIQLGKELGADQFHISNVLPHTRELTQEVLYRESLYYLDKTSSHWVPKIQLPRMDLNQDTVEPISKLINDRNNLVDTGKNISTSYNTCPFIESNSTAIRWDGEVSPCLPLLHTHEGYLDDVNRKSTAFSFGNIKQQTLKEIWMAGHYTEFRDRVKSFDFSPCTYCNSCEMAESNLEDCFGNTQPTCGGCLWAQGFIQCP